MKIIDVHTHQWNVFAEPANLGRFLERNPEIHWLVLASDLRGGYYPSPEEVAESNRSTLRFISLFPDRLRGWCYLNPRWPSATDELKRGLDQGLLGVKLWIATRCSDPVTFPVVEAAVMAGVPLLVHTWRKSTGNLPPESPPTDMAELAGGAPPTPLPQGAPRGGR